MYLSDTHAYTCWSLNLHHKLDCSSQIEAVNIQMSTLKNDLEQEHEKWRVAQRNYERQVCEGSLYFKKDIHHHAYSRRWL